MQARLASWSLVTLQALIGLLVPLLVLVPVAAQAMDCKLARTPAEQLICGDEKLLQQDAEMAAAYAKVRAATSAPLRGQLLDSQRKWLACRDRACTSAKSCGTSLAARQAVLDALAARVSDSNPQLLDLKALALTGTWQAQAVSSADGAQAVPAAGTVMQFSPGKLCTRSCADFGLEPGAVQQSDRLASTAGVPVGAPLLTAIVDGKAAYALLVLPGGKLAAVYNSCTADLRDCGPVLQPWVALSADARVIELTPQGQRDVQ